MPKPPKKIKMMENKQHGKSLGKGSSKASKSTGSKKSGAY